MKKKKITFGRVLGAIAKVIGTLLLVGLLTALIFACIFAVYVKNDLSQQVDFEIQDMSLNQTSIIYVQDRATGEWEELQKLYSGENRIWASYDELPKDLINACIAIEDKRFYEHQGFDLVTTGQAGLRLFLGQGSAGGSTITQQLIKNLTGEQEITVRRKIVEIFRAIEFEKTHSKEEVLEWYMNVIYLGEGCFGVRSAALTYFGKDVSDLTLAECASLIGITNNPSLYDPYIHPENNLRRQRIILGEMLEQEMISQTQYDQALAQELIFTGGDEDSEEESSGYYSYFVDQVIRDVVAE
ncbi:MAG: transglycosylase domain-containing protein, partial [Oscillospiraceae bacterium]|nr:transglycosylase domain-containing protein [Oscillospiraceae bacterium]